MTDRDDIDIRRWDAPNQQAVRPDESSPADEGEGGSARESEEEAQQRADREQQEALDAMTKAELIEEAERRGIDVDSSATKAEIREAFN